MKFGFKTKSKNQLQKERRHVLEFIQNNAAKNDFVNWLNANYKHQFTEDADWEKIIDKVKGNEAIRNAALHNYATTLTDNEDVAKLLKDVEKETTKAEAAVSELYDLSDARKLQPIIGGACLLGGVLLLVVAAGLLSGTLEIPSPDDFNNYLIILSGVYGLLNVFAGILLVLE